MFWWTATALLIATGVFLAWPLLSKGSQWKSIGLAVAVSLPIAGLILYQGIGTPTALGVDTSAAPTPDMNELVDSLRGRLSEREEDLEGWMLLGRSLKSMQRFDESVSALETADRIDPGNPLIQVELVEARLYASGNPEISPEMRSALHQALEQDPSLQKALWLLGIDSVQHGDDGQAIAYWERLLTQVEPGNPVAQTVQEQIALARQRLGEPADAVPTFAAPAEASPSEGSWPGFQVEVALGEPQPESLPQGAVLFVIVRPSGQSAGPPLGVARIDQPSFPVSLTIDDANSMMPGRELSGFEQFTVRARLSLTGQVVASPGDRESEAIEVARDAQDMVALILNLTVD